MSVSVETFRMRVGCFNQPRRKKYKLPYKPSNMKKPSFNLFSRLIFILILTLTSYSHIHAVNIHTASFSSEITSSARLCSENYFSESIRQVQYTEFKLPRTYSLLLKNTNLCHDKSPLQFPAGASHTNGMLKGDTNFYAKCTNGNRRQHGIKIAHFNKGPAYLHNKIHEVENIIHDHQPHLLGLSEANLLAGHDLDDVHIQDYDMYTCPTLENPSIKASRIVVYKHSSLTGKLRPDLMNDGFSSIWLEIGFPRQKKILVCQFYRDWQFLNQPDKSSRSEAAQLQRWIMFLDQWERALSSEMECHILGDCNIDAQPG